MNKKLSMATLMVFAALSLPFVAIGTFLRLHSPLYDDWSKDSMAGVDPAHGVALAFVSWWPIVTFIWFLGFTFFIGTVVVMSWIFIRTHRPAIRVLSTVVFVLPTAIAAMDIMSDSFSDFGWGFYVMAIGECLSVVALILGILHMTTKWRKNETKPA